MGPCDAHGTIWEDLYDHVGAGLVDGPDRSTEVSLRKAGWTSAHKKFLG